MKNKIIISAISVILVIAIIVSIPIMHSKGKFSKGNKKEYSVANTEVIDDSPLKDKTILFLGSSVTYGSAAKGESFVDYIEKRDGAKVIKNAVPGTTMVEKGKKSYVKRLNEIDTSQDIDLFVCQLSTNDAKKKCDLGKVNDSMNIETYDTTTVAGAIEYIACYVYKTWQCPVYFYTNTKFKSKQYEKMIDVLFDAQSKWGFSVINLWDSPQMNAVSKEDYKLYMVNSIHPSRAGYKLWWTPMFELFLNRAFYEKEEYIDVEELRERAEQQNQNGG